MPVGAYPRGAIPVSVSEVVPGAAVPRRFAAVSAVAVITDENPFVSPRVSRPGEFV